MLSVLDYTDVARRFVVKSPMLSYLSIQVTFWILANNLMGLIIHYHSLMIGRIFNLPIQSELKSVAMLASVLGILYGIVLGTITYRLERGYFRRQSLGRIMVIKLFVSVGFGLFIFSSLSVISPKLNIPSLLPAGNFSLAEKTSRYSFYIFALFYLIMTLLIGFINLMNKRYGPGIIVPLIMGKYRNPIEEERIFMFMDLQSSTTIAEHLGHLKYSSFIRDCFWDINHVLSHYHAEIYQYAGDEIIISWKPYEGFRNFSFVRFFFACDEQFLKRTDHYKKKYGLIPTFKAAIHMGKITAVEVGDIKREIAYHGDTINTTARIQGLCNQYNKRLLVSEYLLSRSGISSHFKTEALGMVQLKGKLTEIGVASVDSIIIN